MDNNECVVCCNEGCPGVEDPSRAHELLSQMQPSNRTIDEFYRDAMGELLSLGATFDEDEADKVAKEQGYEDWADADWAEDDLRDAESTLPDGLVAVSGEDHWAVWRI